MIRMYFAFLAVIMLFQINHSVAQSDAIVGIWRTEEGDSQIEIYKNSSGRYEGKLVWLKEPRDDNGRLKKDKENPNERLRSRPLKGLVIIKDFKYNSNDKEWEDGNIYDPESGSTYDAYMWMDGTNTLKLKGFVMGMRWMGRSTTWTRDKSVNE